MVGEKSLNCRENLFLYDSQDSGRFDLDAFLVFDSWIK